jgi:hypothetical protein
MRNNLEVAVTVTSGPCIWPDVGDQICCEEWDTYSAALKDQAATYAKMVLWAATGRQYGLCELTVRPCGKFCEDCGYNGWYYDGMGAWVPYIYNGEWHNCWCGGNGPGGCCTCSPDCQVYLPGPVASIVSVRVDGASLNVTGGDIFVLDQQWLVRTDTTACWPQCADQNLAPGDTDAFEVTYLRGLPVPDALAKAYASLACEYSRACLGLPCRLPSRVSSISRQGVTISMVDIAELLRNGLTGLWEVDQVILALNPGGLKGRTRFWSPDMQDPRQVTWP